MTLSNPAQPEVDDALVGAFLTASRALVGVAARSLAAGTSDITLSQHRALVLLASRGPQRMADLASLLGVNSSTATRHCDRLQRRGLLQRDRSPDDGRAVRVSLTDAGHRLVQQVTQARRAEISQILRAMPDRSRQHLIAALHSFAEAAGEVPEQHWTLGWGTES
ncbi:MarR family winged helix-turn-helix transcriptional regulator [Actinoplanes sp. NPDC049681]|uniref:MarR family winged helix-turn-helix transcriptional regulator n=1 Tax=Actinoplanes sp. NPDC049681 TaxID=3363905 RepID=UPI0037ADFFC0